MNESLIAIFTNYLGFKDAFRTLSVRVKSVDNRGRSKAKAITRLKSTLRYESVGIKRIRDPRNPRVNNECSTAFCDNAIYYYLTISGLKLTRQTPPGECGRKVKLKGIDGDLYKGWRCGLIRIPRKTLPIFVSGLILSLEVVMYYYNSR